MSNFSTARIAPAPAACAECAMRVAVLGGAGEIGAEVVRDLAGVADIDSLVIADVDQGEAAKLAGEFDSGRVTACGLNLRDREAAARLLADTELLMNCTSFTLFDDALALAVRARVDYADLISEPTDAHRQAARDAGITAISGLGATPGLSNVLVRHAAEELDELREVNISWVSWRTVAPTRGLLDTILWEASEDCPTRCYYTDGRLERVAFLEGSRSVVFPAPIGRQFVYCAPHPEVMTLPRHFPSLRECAVRGSWRPELMQDVRVLNRYGLLAPATIEATKQAIWQRCGGARDSAACMLYVNVAVGARHEDSLVSRTYNVSHPVQWGQRGLARMTGVPAAVGVQLLARHGRTMTGFVDPEQYYDPFEFLDELRRRGGIDVEYEQAVVAAAPRDRAPI